jgi:4-oxalmesaconate hydratase
MVGAVRGKDPQTGYDFDDTKRYVDHAPGLSVEDKKKIFEGNALRAYPRLKSKVSAKAAARS